MSTNPLPWDGDPTFIVEEARKILRLAADDPDLDRLGRLAFVVMELVRQQLDAEVPYDDPAAAPIPDPITDACITALVEQYRRKDAPFGITGAWSADGVAMRVSKDWLDPVLFALQPYKSRWGVA
jgi:hypothetical protein